MHFPATPGRVHNLYLEFIEAPPEGVTYVLPRQGETGYVAPAGAEDVVDLARSASLVRRVYRPVLQHVLGGLGIKDRVDAWRGRERPWEVYHALGGAHPYPEPWVVSFESALDFFGFSRHARTEISMRGPRRYAERRLLSPHCRRLLPWTHAAKRSIMRTFPASASALDAKMEVVPLAIRAGPEPRPRPARTPRILFVGSRNFPQDFIANKGGNLALEAFALLRARMEAEMVVRAVLPPEWRAKHAATPDLTIVDGMLSDEELGELYADADIFLFSGHHTPGMVILEAMRAGLPVVALDVWANAELVGHGETGLLVRPQDHVPYLTATGAPNWSHDPRFIEAVTSRTEDVAGRLADALERLARDPALRSRMGAAGRARVATGEFSIKRRNERLRRIYEDAANASA